MMFSDYYTPIGSGVDFDSNPITITIEAGSTEGRGNISVSCDNVVEGVESFDMNLTVASDNLLVRVGRDTSVGRITDSTGMIEVPCKSAKLYKKGAAFEKSG